MSINPLKQLYNDFMCIISNIVVKYRNEAEEYETAESKRNGDQLVNAVLQRDSFDSYLKYNQDIVASVMGLTNEAEIIVYSENKNRIPLKYRDEIFRKQHNYIIATDPITGNYINYTEMNNYYRCLSGMPNIEEKPIDFIYVDESIANKYDIDSSIPIHLMSEPYISILSAIGYIEKMKQEHPDKKYLNYLGSNKVDIVTARTSLNFGLLRIPTNISDSLLNSFLLIYEQCRQYFMTCIYIYEYKQTIPYYDNFIALCIMVMSMQQVIARTLKNTIDRDFFDPYCIKLLFEAYNVPYNADMDAATQSQLLQNLNMLILNKGTNKVIYDIAAILGYERLEIYKYYLMKVQKFDKEGYPIVVYKKNEFGQQVLDYQQMFDIYFQKISIEHQDVYDILSDNNNRVSYNDVTYEDPFWIDDDELMKELYESEYNYVESKYMSVGISYRMTQILFENIYFLRMILDKKDEIPGIILDIPKISLYTTITLFDAVVILSAIMCKQNNLKGEILTDLSKILHVLEFNYEKDGRIISADARQVKMEELDMHVMGFNFEKTFKQIQDEVKSNKYLNRPVKNKDGTKEQYTYADEICNFFKDPTTITAEGVNNLYNNFKNFYDFLLERMSTVEDINLYTAYKKLYKGIFYTKESREMFNIGSELKPVYATTYMEYLHNTLPEIAVYIENTEKNSLYDTIRYIVSRIMSLFPDLKHLGFFDGHSNIMEKMLINYINFFKSYTTDLVSMNIIYVFDLKPDSLMRLIDHVKIKSRLWTKDNFKLPYSDNLLFTSYLHKKDILNFYEKIIMSVNLSIFDTKKFMDSIWSLKDITELKDNSLGYFDSIQYLYKRFLLNLKFIFSESLQIYNEFNLSSKISFIDFISTILNSVLKEHLNLIDEMIMKIGFKKDDNIYFIDKINKMINIIKSKDYLIYNEKINYISKGQRYDGTVSLFDNTTVKNDINEKDNLCFKDNCKISYN